MFNRNPAPSRAVIGGATVGTPVAVLLAWASARWNVGLPPDVLVAVANTPDPHANRLEQLQHELIAAADRRRELVAAIAEARRARRALIVAAVVASAAAGVTFMVLVAVAIDAARHLIQ